MLPHTGLHGGHPLMSPGHAAALSSLHHGVKQEPGLSMGLLGDQNHRYNLRFFSFSLSLSLFIVTSKPIAEQVPSSDHALTVLFWIRTEVDTTIRKRPAVLRRNRTLGRRPNRRLPIITTPLKVGFTLTFRFSCHLLMWRLWPSFFSPLFFLHQPPRKRSRTSRSRWTRSCSTWRKCGPKW